LDISRKTDKGGLAFIPHWLNDHAAAADVISTTVTAAVAVAVGEINLRRHNSRGGGRWHGGGAAAAAGACSMAGGAAAAAIDAREP